MDLSHADAVARGIVSAVLTNQIEQRGIVVQRVLAGGSIASMLAWLLIDGWTRWLVTPVAVLCIAGFFLLFVARRMLLAATARIAPPGDLRHLGGAADVALAEADLPSSPLAAARMVWRLRRGVGPELARLRAVLDALVAAVQ
jgi:hypothetical protein